MNKTLAQLRKLYDLLVRSVSSLQSPFLGVVRVYSGWQIAPNGWGKLHNLGNVTQFFGSLGLPAPGATAAFAAADPFVFFFVGFLILIFGPGKISIEAFSKHIFRKRALHAGSSVPA